MKLIVLFLLSDLVSQPKVSVFNYIKYNFEDGFETITNDLSELFVNSDCSFGNHFENTTGSFCRWTNIQKVDPSNGVNEISIENEIVLTGNNSLKFLARATNNNGILSKMDIEKSDLYLQVGINVRIEADFYIASEADLENLVLLDLEGCQLWDPTVPENQCPGVRLLMKSNDYLSIDRGKIGGLTMTQKQISFPRNQWVKVVWDMLLSDKRDFDVNSTGINKLYIGNQEVISQRGMNMPNADLFREIFAANLIDFELQMPLYYERVQVGITANPTTSDITVYVDNFKINSYKYRHK